MRHQQKKEMLKIHAEQGYRSIDITNSLNSRKKQQLNCESQKSDIEHQNRGQKVRTASKAMVGLIITTFILVIRETRPQMVLYGISNSAKNTSLAQEQVLRYDEDDHSPHLQTIKRHKRQEIQRNLGLLIRTDFQRIEKQLVFKIGYRKHKGLVKWLLDGVEYDISLPKIRDFLEGHQQKMYKLYESIFNESIEKQIKEKQDSSVPIEENGLGPRQVQNRVNLSQIQLIRLGSQINEARDLFPLNVQNIKCAKQLFHTILLTSTQLSQSFLSQLHMLSK